MNPPKNITRRPIKSRSAKWATGAASLLARSGVRPNSISIIGVFFAAAAGACFYWAGRTPTDWRFSSLMILAICGMQGRLLCNLFDGMVAIEGGLKTKSGEIFNELPDRFSDALIFIGAAYALPTFSHAIELGWTAAMLAVITAYVRALGASMGAGQHFIGPMAKPQRMALMTIACLIAAFTPLWEPASRAIPVTLIIIIVGTLITIGRRCQLIVAEMEAK